jgi:hypothetical protein
MKITRKDLMDGLGGLDITVRDEENPFSTGNTGYFMGGRIIIGGVQHQVSCNITKSKLKKPKKDDTNRKVLK